MLAAVFGPKAGTKKNENPEKACIEVIWKPKSGQIGENSFSVFGYVVRKFIGTLCTRC